MTGRVAEECGTLNADLTACSLPLALFLYTHTTLPQPTDLVALLYDQASSRL